MNALRRLGCGTVLTVAVVWVGGQTASAAEPGHASTIAIVVGQDYRAPSPLMEPALIEGLSKLPEVTLIEREEIRHVLDEMALSAGGLVDPARAIQFGRLLSAEAFLLVEQERIPAEWVPEAQWLIEDTVQPVPETVAGEQPRPPLRLIRARLIETRTGIRLLDWFSENQETEEGRARLVGALIEELRSALGKLGVPHERRQYLGMLGLRSEEPSATLDPAASALTALVEYDLGRMPGVVVLEWKQLQRLRAEENLTGIEFDLRASALLLEGGLRRAGDAEQVSITLKLVPLAGGDTEPLRVLAPAGDLGAMRDAVVRAVGTAIEVSADPAPPGDRRKQAAVFADRAKHTYSNARGRDERKLAVPFAEAALALDPTLEHHRLAAHICIRSAATLSSGLLSMSRPPVHDLRLIRRAHEIDADMTELKLRRSDPPEDEPVIGYRTFPAPRYPDFSHLAYALPGFTRVDSHLYTCEPEADQERRLLLEINAECKRSFEALLELRRRRGATPLELALLRLRHSWQLAATGNEFAEMIHTNVSAIDQLFDAGPVKRASCPEYYQYLSEQFNGALPPLALILPTVREAGLMNRLPAFEWLAEHNDPATRAVGYAGISMCSQGQGTRDEAAKELLDILFRQIPGDQLLPRSYGYPFTGLALGGASGARTSRSRLVNGFEPILKQAETDRDATRLVRFPLATVAYATAPRGAAAREALARLKALVDTKAFDSRWEKQAEELRGLVIAHQEGRLVLGGPSGPRVVESEAPTELGPWADYLIRPIPLEDWQLLDGKLVATCIEDPQDGSGEDPTLVLVWTNPPPGSGGAVPGEITVRRMSIPGGDVEPIGRCQLLRPIGAISVAADGGRVAVTIREAALVLLTDGVPEVFDESNGLPGREVGSPTWLDGQLYLTMLGAIARFDPGKREFTILASSRSVDRRNALDGEGPYYITWMVSDPQRHCLWFSLLPAEDADGYLEEPERAGIWRYTPATNRFELIVQDDAGPLTWSDGSLVYCTDWRTSRERPEPSPKFCLLDPDSLTTRPLKGYQVRGREAQLMRLLEIQWLLMGNRLFVGDAWLYTPDGKAYHYKLDRPPPRQLGTDQRPQACRIMGRAGRGFVIDDRAGSQDSTPLLWYVEPREP